MLQLNHLVTQFSSVLLVGRVHFGRANEIGSVVRTLNHKGCLKLVDCVEPYAKAS